MRVFYSLQRLTEEEKQNLNELINNDDLVKAKRMMNSIINPIAFGKLSEGKQFLFYCNRLKYYKPNFADINNFLRKEDRVIIDDKGKKLNADYIWSIVDDNRENGNYESEFSGMTEEQIDFYELESETFTNGKEWMKEYNPKFGEFYNDNLRFSSIL